MPDPFATLQRLLVILDGLQLDYVIGGSLASSFYGIPRATNDIDAVVDLAPERLEAFLRAAEVDFYLDPHVAAEAVRERRVFNLLDRRDFDRVDIFVLPETPSRRQQVLRRRKGELVFGSRRLWAFLPSPEDLILTKLEWYQLGNQVSERQWDDVRNVLRLQAANLDWSYLTDWAAAMGLTTLLARARAEVQEQGPARP